MTTQRTRNVPAVSQRMAIITTEYPDLWRTVDEVRRLGGGKHPSWSWVSESEMATAMAKAMPDVALMAAFDNDMGVAAYHELHFLAAWRASRNILRFDPSLRDALINAANPEGPLSHEVFTRLPHHGVYVERPGLFDRDGIEYEGVGASLICSGPDNAACLNVIFLHGEAGGWKVDTAALTLDGRPLNEAIATALAGYGHEANAGRWTANMSKAVSLLLWLCQDKPEISPNRGHPPPLPTRREKGRVIPIGGIARVWDVGLRVGETLRLADGGDTRRAEWKGGAHASPRPHVRRGHWHLYWTGTGKAVPKVCFVHPCLVNVHALDALPTVLRKAA